MAKQTVSNGMSATGVRTPAFPRKTIFVSVTKSILGTAQEKRELGVTPNTPSVDYSRGFWNVDYAKASQCELLVAVCKNRIVGVWEIDRTEMQHVMPFQHATLQLSMRGGCTVKSSRRFCRKMAFIHDAKCQLYKDWVRCAALSSTIFE